MTTQKKDPRTSSPCPPWISTLMAPIDCAVDAIGAQYNRLTELQKWAIIAALILGIVVLLPFQKQGRSEGSSPQIEIEDLETD